MDAILESCMEPATVSIRSLSKYYPAVSGFGHNMQALMTGRWPVTGGVPALDDVSLDIAAGEAVGLIGRNGSGKTTLLRLIAGVSAPTGGEIRLPGQISSLIELGAGFSPQLDAVRNIRRECALTGLPVRWADAHMDRILGFAELPSEVARRPLGTWSTGERMRLGFALAVTRPASLLVIDELLAVGDERFHQRCLETFRDLRRAGCTVVLASHALGQVRAVCDRVVWLEGGRVRSLGPAWQVTEDYRREMSRLPEPPADQQESATDARRDFVIERVVIEPGLVPLGSAISIRVQYRAARTVARPNLGVAIHRDDGVLCYGTSSVKLGIERDEMPPGTGVAEAVIPGCPLLPGRYFVTVALFDADDVVKYDYHDRRYSFTVTGTTRDDGVSRIEMRMDWGR